MTNGFLRVAAVAPAHRVADVNYNVEQIIESMSRLEAKGVDIAVYPELCITGYTCGDLFHSQTLLQAAADGLQRIVDANREMNIDVIVGLPRQFSGAVYNSAAFVSGGVAVYTDKTYLPNYNEFYERRWFAPAPKNQSGMFNSHGVTVGVEICEDLWVPAPPSSQMAMDGALVLFNLSASDDLIGKYAYLRQLIAQQSGRCMAAYVYASAGFGESTTDVVFLPKTIIAENGSILAENDRYDYLNNPETIADIDIEALMRDRSHTTTFADCAARHADAEEDYWPSYLAETPFDPNFQPEYRRVNPSPFVPPTDELIDQRCREISTIQECGLARRLQAIGSSKITVGISGGLDSTLALLVACGTLKTLGKPATDITAVTMPGFGTTGRTYQNALQLMRQLGVTIREIPIADAVNQHFKDINHDPANHDVTYENSQARERTQILMDIANQTGGIVLGTGDLSELALGWATYNGDHMSMYGVNAGVPKTLVKYLVRHYADRTAQADPALHATLLDIIDTPISPELTPADAEGNIAQKTEELVGPYRLHDFFLYYMLRYGFEPRRVLTLAQKAFEGEYDRATLVRWMRNFYRRFFNQQFKRSCLPDGPKVGSVCLSPRGDWRMPSDATSALWLAQLPEL